jgi:hypothetical protein
MQTRRRFTITDAVDITGRFLWLWNAEQLTRFRDIVGPAGIGQEAIVADEVEPVGQDMDQKAANELVSIEYHKLVASVELGPVILPFESHAFAVEGDEPAIGNGDPVGVAGEVGKHRVGSAKRPLGIDGPFNLSQCGEVSLKAAGSANAA